MLKSKFVRQLLHALIVLLGGGLGVAATLGALQLFRYLRPTESLPFIYLAGTYLLAGGLGALIFHLLSDKIIHACTELNAFVERYLAKLSSAQLVSSCLGLLGGMIIAALLCQIVAFMGDSIFTTAVSGILYVVLGLTGFSVGRSRSGDMSAMMDKALARSSRRKTRVAEEASAVRVKVLDASALIDGRILEVARLGFVEGDMVIPRFVLAELQRIADSADNIRRIRGRRGLDVARKLMDDEHLSVRLDETDYPELLETDMKLLRLARELDAAVISGDTSLCKVARLSSMTALNLSELAVALRPAVTPGEELTVQLVKEGKESGQGVGYMPDGTMIVVEGGRSMLGRTVEVTVTSALQTSAGRMIFAKLRDEQTP